MFRAEPNLDERFTAMENVVLAPHYASVTREARQDMIGFIMRNMATWLDGRPVPNAAA